MDIITTAFMYITAFIGLYTSIFFLITHLDNWGERKVEPIKDDDKLKTVTVLVPCYNEEKTLERTINSLKELDYPKEKLKIIIIDDGSTDNTYEIAKKLAQKKDPEIKVLRKKNGGKHTALNLGLKHTKTELVGCLDADSTVAKDSLRKVVKQFKNEKVMAVTPSMKIEKPKGILRRVQATEFILGILMRRVFTDLGSQTVTPGPFTIFRKEFFDKHGPYRKAYKTEDIEVALRIQKHNYIIENATDAYVYTHGPSTFKSLYKQRLRWYYGFISNVMTYKELFGKKHGNLGLFILPLSLLSVILTIGGLAIFLVAFLRQWYRTIMNYYQIGFDWKKMFEIKFDPFFINTSNVMIISWIVLLFAILLIYLAWRLSGEDRNIVVDYLYFLMFYWILYGYWWLSSIYHKIMSKDVEWGHKTKYEGKKAQKGS